jgi:hypothetical protein
MSILKANLSRRILEDFFFRGEFGSEEVLSPSFGGYRDTI